VAGLLEMLQPEGRQDLRFHIGAPLCVRMLMREGISIGCRRPGIRERAAPGGGPGAAAPRGGMAELGGKLGRPDRTANSVSPR
jgi:hypothetical protein